MKLFKRSQDRPREPRLDGEASGYVFRRSRTLTGTTSTKVTVGAAQRSQLKTARMQVHDLHVLRNRILKILGVLLVCIAIVGYGVVGYIGSFNFQYPQPGGAPKTAGYQKTLQDYFAKHPLERFGFAINQKQLTSDLQTAHPEINGLDITKQWYGGDVAFVVTFRRPILVWETDGKRFYVDSQGVAFEYDHFGGRYVAVSDQSGIPPATTGGAVTSNRFINFLGKMVGAVNGGGKGSVADVIIPAATREIDLKLQGRGYLIKTQTDRDPLQQAQDIVNALTWFDTRKVTPQYIDVRTPNKAFYK